MDLQEVEKYLHRAISGYYTHPRHEDAFQEGLIRAWKDINGETEYEDAHILNRAKKWAIAFMLTPHKVPTGHIKTSRDAIGTAQGDRTREKAVQYYNEFWELHDRKPTAKEVAQGTGLSESRARAALRQYREGRYDHAIYEDRGDGEHRLSSSYYSEVHFESMAASDAGESDAMSKIGLFEDPCNVESEVIAQQDFLTLIDQVPETHKHTLLLRFGYDMQVEDIGRILSPESTFPKERGSNRVQRAVAAMKKVLDPEPETPFVGTCKNGHERTEENTLVVSMKNGVTRRQCIPCKKAAQERYNAKRRNVVTSGPLKNCKRGHVIDGQRKNGSRYCRTCNQEGQARRNAARKKKK
jgi:DNA-directed RNA polymerase specialized sigma24 family protein